MTHPDFRQHRQVKELTDALMEQRAAHHEYCKVLEARIARAEEENEVLEAMVDGVISLVSDDPVLAKEYVAKVRQHWDVAADLAEKTLFEE